MDFSHGINFMILAEDSFVLTKLENSKSGCVIVLTERDRRATRINMDCLF